MKRGRLLLAVVFVGLLLSGVGLYFCLPGAIDDFPHPLNGLLRQWHGLFALLSLFSLGQMWAEHIRKQLRQWRQHPDGIAHVCIWLLLVCSGYFLYYPPAWLTEQLPSGLSLGQLHWWFGIALLLILPVHILVQKRGTRRTHSQIHGRKIKTARA